MENCGGNIKDQIKIITNNSNDYNEKYIKIKYNSDDDLSLKKMLELYNMEIVVRVAFHEVNKYHQQVFSGEFLYKSWII